MQLFVTVRWANNMARVAPRFQVKTVKNRKITETVLTKNPDFKEDGIHFLRETKERVIPESFMVFFPGGHSTWFETREAMVRAGIIDNDNYDIDLDTGLPMEKSRVVDLENVVNSKTRNNNSMAMIGE